MIVILFVLLNLILYLIFINSNNVPASFRHKKLNEAYPNLTKSQISKLLHETWQKIQIYEPRYTKQLDLFMKGGNLILLKNLPIVKLIQTFKPTDSFQNTEMAKSVKVMQSNFEMEKKIGKEYNISVYNVIQPIPTYKYCCHFLNVSNLRNLNIGYDLIRRGVIWFADIQENITENLYVDNIHYNPKFNKLIAKK